MEFAYNHSMYGAMRFSPFEVVYGFNRKITNIMELQHHGVIRYGAYGYQSRTTI